MIEICKDFCIYDYSYYSKRFEINEKIKQFKINIKLKTINFSIKMFKNTKNYINFRTLIDDV